MAGYWANAGRDIIDRTLGMQEAAGQCRMPTAAEAREHFAREREERKKPQGPPRLVMSAQAMRDLVEAIPCETIALPFPNRYRTI
jgi:hypothetical protein